MKVSTTARYIIIIMIALSIICFGIGVFFVNNTKSFLLGLVFGTGFSILNLILLEKTLEKAMDMKGAKAVNYTRLHYTLRYFLVIVVLLISVYRKEYINIYAVVIGIFILRPAIWIVNLKNKRLNKEI